MVECMVAIEKSGKEMTLRMRKRSWPENGYEIILRPAGFFPKKPLLFEKTWHYEDALHIFANAVNEYDLEIVV